MKRMLCIGMATIMLTLYGCGSDTATTDNSSSTPSVEGEATTEGMAEETDLSVMIYDRANAPDGQGTAADNRWTNWVIEEIKKAENINLSYVSVPRSEAGTKVPVMVASQTGPDIMFEYDKNMIFDFYEDGGIHDTAPYIAEYGADLVAYLTEECLENGQNENGEQITISARRSTPTAANYFIRQDWLDKLGLEVPKTPDDLYNVLVAFKEQDPSGVGSQNIIPASFIEDGAWNLSKVFFNNMGDEKERFITGNNGLLYKSITDPEGALEFFKYFNKLYNEALIDQEYFVDTGGASRVNEWIVTSKLGFLESNVNYNVDYVRGGLLQSLKETTPEAEFISIPPLENVNDGEQYNFQNSLTGVDMFVPKTCESPEAAIKYLNFIATDIGHTIYNGFEGEHYELDEDNIAIPIDPEYNATDKDWLRYDLFMLGNPGYFKTEEDFVVATAKEDPTIEEYVLKNYEYAAAGVRQANYNYTSEAEKAHGVDINTIFSAYKVEISTSAPEDVEELFNKMLAELEASPAMDVIAERGEYYDTYMAE